MYKNAHKVERFEALEKAAMQRIAELRWGLTERKYRDGLTGAEHEHLLWLSDYTWRHRWEIKK